MGIFASIEYAYLLATAREVWISCVGALAAGLVIGFFVSTFLYPFVDRSDSLGKSFGLVMAGLLGHLAAGGMGGALAVWLLDARIGGVCSSYFVGAFAGTIWGTKRTSYPSEWYSGFHRFKRELVLYLKDERRVRGWAEEYPDQCDKGHFLLQHVSWLDDDGNEYPQDEVEATMIAASDVQMVQFLPEKLKKPLEEVNADKQRLINFRKKEAEAATKKKEFADGKSSEGQANEQGGDQTRNPVEERE